MNWTAFRLSLQVTITATIGIAIVGLLLALLLARHNFRGKLLLETIIYLPIILPPTVVGYYLLFVLGRGSFLKEVLQQDLLFTWQSAALAGMIVGLPLMVQSARAALEDVEVEIEDAARVDGASEWQVLRFITISIARRGIMAGLTLGAARALGDFGTTLMVAGNLPGRTQTLPLAIYDAVQNRQYEEANVMVITLTAFAFGCVWLIRQSELRQQRARKTHRSSTQQRNNPV